MSIFYYMRAILPQTTVDTAVVIYKRANNKLKSLPKSPLNHSRNRTNESRGNKVRKHRLSMVVIKHRDRWLPSPTLDSRNSLTMCLLTVSAALEVAETLGHQFIDQAPKAHREPNSSSEQEDYKSENSSRVAHACSSCTPVGAPVG